MDGVEQKHRDKNATFSVTAQNISTCANRDRYFSKVNSTDIEDCSISGL